MSGPVANATNAAALSHSTGVTGVNRLARGRRDVQARARALVVAPATVGGTAVLREVVPRVGDLAHHERGEEHERGERASGPEQPA